MVDWWFAADMVAVRAMKNQRQVLVCCRACSDLQATSRAGAGAASWSWPGHRISAAEGGIMRAGDWRALGRVPSTKGSHFVQEKKLLGFLGRLEGRCRGWFYRAFYRLRLHSQLRGASKRDPSQVVLNCVWMIQMIC